MRLRPYLELMRLDKPIGVYLLFFPAGWAVALAAPAASLPSLLMLMLLGALITRAAGCIVNDLTDRKLDAQVERTRHRPLACGALPVWHAYFLLAVLLFGALLIALTLPKSVFLLALLALPMIAAYPWMKRITWWPQFFLGLTFNLSALFGWLATGSPLSAPALTLYGACIFWTLGYDTIYAVQDITDDARVGIRSSARTVGAGLKPFVAVCYMLMTAGLCMTCALLGTGMIAYLGVAAAALHAGWQIHRLPVQPEHAGALFRSNQWLGCALLLALLLARAV